MKDGLNKFICEFYINCSLFSVYSSTIVLIVLFYSHVYLPNTDLNDVPV